MTTDMDVVNRGETPPEDPDAQHTVTDFLDYTEYLPSDLTRSLTLIGKLDEFYLTSTGSVHELSKEYGLLPKQSPKKATGAQAQALRHEISHNLDHAISCREASYGEALRLYEVVDRHHNRLSNIIAKLHALPKPPSRDPTPVPRSPQAIRHTPAPRITLRLDGARAAANANRTSPKPDKKQRSRKITVPGEVLPPPNPDSPLPFTDSDWESVPPSPIPMPTSRVGGSRKPGRIRTPKHPKAPRLKAPKTPRPPRPPGAVGTNVHSAVAGISTSNALSLLTPPPPDAKPGSKHAPWMRLTEWEMAKLRKRMKKNAIWTPSETMIRRELSSAGRGPDAYKKARAQAEPSGEDFIDEDNIASAEPGRPLLPGEISADSLGLAETNLENRGMKLNEAKKMKREVLAKERAAELESEAQKLGSLGTTFKQLFSKPPSQPLLSPSISINSPKNQSALQEKVAAKAKPEGNLPEKAKAEPKEAVKAPAKKRKRDETPKAEIQPAPAEDPAPTVKQTSKKRKTDGPQPAPRKTPAPLTISTQTVTTTVPLAAPAPSPKKPAQQSIQQSAPATPATPVMAAPEKPKALVTPKPTATASRPRRVSLTLKGPAEPPLEPVEISPRTATRATSRRSSVDRPQSATILRDHPRRKSATPATPSVPVSPATVVTAASRRSKRPAPGLVVESHDGGAAISVGKRRHAPGKRAGPNARRPSHDVSTKEKEDAAKELAVMEEIDPDEPRYCLCGDVSYGEMVACENPNVRSPIIELCFPC